LDTRNHDVYLIGDMTILSFRLNYLDHTQFSSKISKWYLFLSLSQISIQIRNLYQCSTLR